MEGEGSASRVFRFDDADKPSGTGLADWCRALEARIESLAREKDDLATDNERLRRRQTELVTLIKGIEQAFIIGRLRSGMPLPDPSGAGLLAGRPGHGPDGSTTRVDLPAAFLKET
jgi:hypothetical protein